MNADLPLIYEIDNTENALGNTIRLFLSSGRLTCEIFGKYWKGHSGMQFAAGEAKALLKEWGIKDVRVLHCDGNAKDFNIRIRLMRMADAPPAEHAKGEPLTVKAEAVGAEWMLAHYKGTAPMQQRLALTGNRTSYEQLKEGGNFTEKFILECDAILAEQLTAAEARKASTTPRKVWDVVLAQLQAGETVPMASLVGLGRCEALIPEEVKSELRRLGAL